MIHQPRRSVTRFFIPMIDVLTLLFCIFILMPFVSVPGTSEVSDPATSRPEGNDPAGGGPESTPTDPVRLARELDKQRRLVEELRQQKNDLLKNLTVMVLEIDASTGRLFTPAPERKEIASALDAQQAIERLQLENRQRRGAQAGEVYFLILLPRELTGYPQAQQIQNYRTWFARVPHGFDSPRRGR